MKARIFTCTIAILAINLISSTSLAGTGKAELNGWWEGELYVYSSAGKHEQPLTRSEQPEEIRILIRGNPVRFWVRDKDGKWQAIYEDFFKLFTFQQETMTITGNYFHTGNDEDGKWVEKQMLYLTRKDADTLRVYWFRGVNNVDLPLDKEWSKWAHFRVGELKRVERSNISRD